MAHTHAERAINNLEPFERLQAALTRRSHGPTPKEIDALVEYRKDDSFAATQEYIQLLMSLKEPLEEAARKAALHQARSKQSLQVYENKQS